MNYCTDADQLKTIKKEIRNNGKGKKKSKEKGNKGEKHERNKKRKEKKKVEFASAEFSAWLCCPFRYAIFEVC